MEYTAQNFEIVKPDPDVIRLIEKVLEQNAKILEMNGLLLEALSNPMVKAS